MLRGGLLWDRRGVDGGCRSLKHKKSAVALNATTPVSLQVTKSHHVTKASQVFAAFQFTGTRLIMTMTGPLTSMSTRESPTAGRSIGGRGGRG